MLVILFGIPVTAPGKAVGDKDVITGIPVFYKMGILFFSVNIVCCIFGLEEQSSVLTGIDVRVVECVDIYSQTQRMVRKDGRFGYRPVTE